MLHVIYLHKNPVIKEGFSRYFFFYCQHACTSKARIRCIVQRNIIRDIIFMFGRLFFYKGYEDDVAPSLSSRVLFWRARVGGLFYILLFYRKPISVVKFKFSARSSRNACAPLMV